MFTLERHIDAQTLSPAIMNGAGCCKTMAHAQALARGSGGAVVIGSSTIEQRDGNEGETFDWNGHRSLNSWGLPNEGLDGFARTLPEMVRTIHDAGRLAIFSIAGSTPEEYARLAWLGKDAGVDFVEVNLSCPNKFGPDGKQQRILSYWPRGISELLGYLRMYLPPGLRMWFKVSYLPDRVLMLETASVFNENKPRVRGVVAMNTLANCLAFDKNFRHQLVPQYSGYAGMGGFDVKPVALGQVQMWREMLHADIPVIGCGGVQYGRDVLEFFQAGAFAVQATSLLLKDGGKLDVAPLERLMFEAQQIIDTLPVSGTAEKV